MKKTWILSIAIFYAFLPVNKSKTKAVKANRMLLRPIRCWVLFGITACPSRSGLIY
jgi:hypothetical protein